MKMFLNATMLSSKLAIALLLLNFVMVVILAAISRKREGFLNNKPLSCLETLFQGLLKLDRKDFCIEI